MKTFARVSSTDFDLHPCEPHRPSPLLFVVEGPNDVQFLRRISRLLNGQSPEFPNMENLERAGKLMFLPIGGNGPAQWLVNLDHLSKAQVHLFDREGPSETAARLKAAGRLNGKSYRRVFVTAKRSLENYLHPEAVSEVCGTYISFGDHEPIAEVVASHLMDRKVGSTGCWNSLSHKTRKRLKDRAKRWLNTLAVERMTFAHVCERDPNGEIRSWLMAVSDLLRVNA